MSQPGDIVMFDFPAQSTGGLRRSVSTYGNVEFLPVPGEVYVLCYDGRFRHWPPDPAITIDWTFSIRGGIPYVSDDVEIRMRVIGRTDTPPETSGGSTVGYGQEEPEVSSA
jgi:hypothetical protein